MRKLRAKFYEFWTLRWVRKMGYEGDQLPVALPCNPSACAVASATGFRVYSYYYYDHREQMEYLPLAVRRFIWLFDGGVYPHLTPQDGDIGIDIDEGEIIPIEQPKPQTVPQETPPVREPEKV